MRSAPERGPLRLVVLGLSLSSSWGNGHATTYRALLKAFAERGHDILFLERDVPWYRAHRDLAHPDYCRLAFYRSLAELKKRARSVAEADAVIVGSYVPDGVAVGRWAQRTARSVVAFYDIDTPVTLAKLERGDHEYLSPDLIPTTTFTSPSRAARRSTSSSAASARPWRGRSSAPSIPPPIRRSIGRSAGT
jgi:spore maturation protein CgeB